MLMYRRHHQAVVGIPCYWGLRRGGNFYQRSGEAGGHYVGQGGFRSRFDWLVLGRRKVGEMRAAAGVVVAVAYPALARAG